MKTLICLVSLTICVNVTAAGDKFDYIIIIQTAMAKNLYIVKSGNETLKTELEDLKLKNVIDAVEYLEDRNWELINFQKEQACQMCPVSLNAYMRKPR